MVEVVASLPNSSKENGEVVQLMSQGAEGRLFLSDLFGQRCVIKERFSKKYRVPALDEKLTKQRILQEVKSMDRIRRMGVLTPGVYLVDQVQRKIFMEYLGDESMTVKAFLYQLGTFDHPSKYQELSSFDLQLTFCTFLVLEQLVDKIATSLATMHSGDSIHGDLTTSNMMIKPKLPLDKQMSGESCKLSA